MTGFFEQCNLDKKDFENAKVHLYNLPTMADFRGKLTFAEYEKPLPFAPKRFFLVWEVPNREIRGEHAHRKCHQFMVCIKGNCSTIVDDGTERAEILLDRPNLGLHIPPMVWTVTHKYSPESVLLVLASEVYQADDYIRDYDLFLKELAHGA